MSSRVRVRYAETDQMGVVYYANYFVWFEVGRTDWLRESGWSYRDMEADGYSLPVIEASSCRRRPPRRVRKRKRLRKARRFAYVDVIRSPSHPSLRICRQL